MLADKGYDSQQVLDAVKKTGGEAVIPPGKHRKYQRLYDYKRYNLRNTIEHTFGFFK
ncbi:transposase (fragment) [Pseudodesulfovibrio piezophilus C1TLV30]|uniref:Transposase n=1 Tax=Pseudodesulfovibrio piezophilus (strain DSM 21447 / JCM 15486 / C1TLV30) TaxID=1322246 RepID=M1WRX5_PSEP2